MPHPVPPLRAPQTAPFAEAYRLVRQNLRGRTAACPDEPQPQVHRSLQALGQPPSTCIDGQAGPRSARYQAEARDEIAREQLDP